MSSSPKSLDSSSTLELLFSPGDKRKGRKRKILLKSIEKTVQISISFLVALLCFYGIYRAIDDTHPETLAKIPKFGSSSGGGGHFLLVVVVYVVIKVLIILARPRPQSALPFRADSG